MVHRGRDQGCCVGVETDEPGSEELRRRRGGNAASLRKIVVLSMTFTTVTLTAVTLAAFLTGCASPQQADRDWVASWALPNATAQRPFTLPELTARLGEPDAVERIDERFSRATFESIVQVVYESDSGRLMRITYPYPPK